MNNEVATLRRRTQLILLSRILTRSGDHAWDLALPLTLIRIFPQSLFPTAFLYLLSRIVCGIALPRLGSWLDRTSRIVVVRIAILVQAVNILIVVLLLEVLRDSLLHLDGIPQEAEVLLFVAMAISFSVAAVCFQIMNITVSLDWVPQLFSPNQLPQVNARLRRWDLIVEVGCPLLVGAALSVFPGTSILNGAFALVAGWNVVSFVIEYGILRRLFVFTPALQSRCGGGDSPTRPAASGKCSVTWFVFFRHPLAVLMLANACLWFTVLTPHGALLTAYLKGSLGVSEGTLGVFRALGACVGVIPTFLVPRLVRSVGVSKLAILSLVQQSCCLVIACLLFDSPTFLWLFLGAIVLSRVGLYAFTLCEMQIRQEHVEPEIRGAINSRASALTSLASLALFASASIFARPDQFYLLVWGSAAVVMFGCFLIALTSRWRVTGGDHQA